MSPLFCPDHLLLFDVVGALFGSISDGVAVVTDAFGVRRDPNEQIPVSVEPESLALSQIHFAS